MEPEKTAYPDGVSLQKFLGNLGLDLPPDLDLDVKVEDASAEWESRTGWGPYLSTGQVTTRLFDPPRQGRSLYLQGGLLSLTSLAVGVVPGPDGSYADSGASAGTLLTPNLNFYLRPQNAAVRGLAVTEVEFLSRLGGVPQSVAVAGVWGRSLLVPGDVWQAVLQKAALDCLPELGISLTGGLVKIEDVQYLTGSGGSPLLNAAGQWEPKFEKLVGRKKRIVV